MFFDTWYDLLRILVVGVLSYAGLIAVLRATGKRTLSKMNAFDFVITIAFGSVLASVMLDTTVSLSEGVLAFALLCVLQFLVAYASSRSHTFENVVKAQPSMLFFRGRYLDDALHKERVSREEVMAAARVGGLGDMDQVDAVILETDGTFSVLANAPGSNEGTLTDVTGHPGAKG